MERKLATIQKILDIQPIPGADAIEVCQILGWKIVIKKADNLQIGDKIVYCEIDSVLPEKPEFEFLKPRGYRIKSIRLKKQISQGIIFPLSILTEREIPYEVGEDVTDILGIKKYEPEIPIYLRGNIKRKFPSYVPKTDETRIQSEPGLLEEFRNKVCYVTVKLDGTSCTFSNMDGEIDACSRNWSYKEENNNVFMELFNKYKIREKLLKIGNYAIQGEIMAPGLQKNRLKLKDPDFFAFNIYDINNAKYLDYSNFIKMCQELEINTVPILMNDFLFGEDVTIDSLLELSRGKYSGTDNHREGIVIRPIIECYSDILQGRLSVKVINNEFLLKE